MRVAVVGSRNLDIDIQMYIPEETTEIVSGGAKGIDALAERWADQCRVPKLIVKPEYEKFGKVAPIYRNELIVDAAELVVAVWDGKSEGTKYTIDYARRIGKRVKVYVVGEG